MYMEFVNLKLITKGEFTEVYLAEEKYSHEECALKIIKTNIMNQKQISLFENEKKILRIAVYYKLKYIVKLLNVIKEPDKYYLVLEYCNGGTLHEYLYKYINRYGKPFPEELVKFLMKRIILGIKSLHDKGIIHRDLKLGNILLNYKNNIDKENQNIYEAEVKIIDFNSSYFPDNSEPTTVIGTLPNMAPSVINNDLGEDMEKPYDEKIDIWSLGTICYEMLFGKSLFGRRLNYEMIRNIFYANFNIPNTISPQARSFLYCMLQKEGYNRFSCEQLLNHKFFTRNNINNNIINPPVNNSIININNNHLQMSGMDCGAAPIIVNKQIKTNIFFRDSDGNSTSIVAGENTKIKDLIILYFNKIGIQGYVNEQKVIFTFNGKNLKNEMNKTIKEMNMKNGSIQVTYSNS